MARAAGVSLKTVSRVVNGEPGVGSSTSERVTDAIRLLGFRRNDLARSLRRAHISSTLGLIIEDVANPFYSAIARAVEEVARARGYVVITASSEENPDREHDLVTTLLSRQVDGVLLVPASSDHRYLRAELALGTQMVFLDRPPEGLPVDAVLIDNAGGARAGVEHLLSQGHRRVGLVGDLPEMYTLAQRVEGYRAAHLARRLDVDERLIRLGAQDVADGESATRELLRLPEPPTALFATNNRLTIGVLRALRDRAGRPALVGFDDFELADMLSLPVTVVRHDPAEMGRRGAALLFARLDGHDGPPCVEVLDTVVVVRGSGELSA